MFRTPKGEARYYAAYEATLALWPVPVHSLQVSTHYGITHVNVCGPENAPPLLLLHGSAVSSTVWYPNAADLSGIYRIYAPDIMGEMGKSIRTRPMQGPADLLAWLLDLVDGLQLEQTHVAGLSLGGYLAMKLACSAPQRLAKLILLSPASLLAVRPQFYLRMAAALLVPFLSMQARQALFLGMASDNAAPAVKQLMTRTDFRYSMFFPPVTPDDELKQIQADTLLLLGEREVIYPPQKAQERAMSLIPRIEAYTIPGAGHALTLDQPQTVNRRILDFLAKDA